MVLRLQALSKFRAFTLDTLTLPSQLTPSCPVFFLTGLNHFLSDHGLSLGLCRFSSEYLEFVLNLCIKDMLEFTATDNSIENDLESSCRLNTSHRSLQLMASIALCIGPTTNAGQVGNLRPTFMPYCLSSVCPSACLLSCLFWNSLCRPG